MRGALVAVLAPVVALLLTASLAADCSIPAPTGDISDFANLLTPADERSLADHVGALKGPGAHLVVVTVPTSGGCTPRDWARRAFDAWGVGEKGKDNGVLVLLALEERRIEVETGEGVERRLSDGTVAAILESRAVAHLRKDRWNRGLMALSEGISRHLSGQHWEGTTRNAARPGDTPLPPRRTTRRARLPPLPRPDPWYVALFFFVFNPLNSSVVLAFVWLLWSLSLPIRGIFLNRRFAAVGVILALYTWASGRVLGRPGNSAVVWILLGLGLVFALYTLTRRCPDCSAGYTEIHDRTLRYATYWSSGLGERTVDCPRCSYHRVSTTVTPRRIRSSPSSSSSGSTSSSSSSWSSSGSSSSSSSFTSFGGGSSGGGGAGRSF